MRLSTFYRRGFSGPLKERTGLEGLRPPVRVSPSFGALAPANPGDSPPAPAKLRPFIRPPYPPALRR